MSKDGVYVTHRYKVSAKPAKEGNTEVNADTRNLDIGKSYIKTT